MRLTISTVRFSEAFRNITLYFTRCVILDYNHEGVIPKAQLRRCDIRDFIYYRCDILIGNI